MLLAYKVSVGTLAINQGLLACMPALAKTSGVCDPAQVKYPENFFLLRGNHECASINRIYGFYDECKRRYNVRLWKIFTDCFNCLPVAALVDEKVRSRKRLRLLSLLSAAAHLNALFIPQVLRFCLLADTVHAWRTVTGTQVTGAGQADTPADRCARHWPPL